MKVIISCDLNIFMSYIFLLELCQIKYIQNRLTQLHVSSMQPSNTLIISDVSLHICKDLMNKRCC